MTRHKRKLYRYIDDTDKAWEIRVSDYLAEVGGLEEIPWGNTEYLTPLAIRMHPRHIKLVGIGDRPGQPKFRTEAVTNERDPSRILNRTFTVHA